MQVVHYHNRSGTLVETVFWEGFHWRRYPESKHQGIRQYFRRTTRNGTNGKLVHFWLHKEVWKSVNGDIPEKHDIHHIDEDTTNNSPENLQAISRSDHSRLHINHLERAIAKAPEWHRSEEGRAWHRQHAKTVAANLPTRNATCQHCGKEYQTKAQRDTIKYCSNKCRHYARKAQCKDHEPRPCVVCGAVFIVDKYTKVLTCSSKCRSIRCSDSAKKRTDRVRVQPGN